MAIIREFNLHTNAGPSIPPVIHVNQYDRGETWKFKLYQPNGQQLTPTDAAIVGIKSDGHIIANAGTVSGGVISITETEQMTAAPGKAVFEILFDNDTHGTANFIVLVEPSPTNDGIASESDLSLFQEAIDSISPATINAAVSAWMSAQLTPSEWVIDNSLTVANAAADAKKAGDLIRQNTADIGDLTDLVTEDQSSLVGAINETRTDLYNWFTDDIEKVKYIYEGSGSDADIYEVQRLEWAAADDADITGLKVITRKEGASTDTSKFFVDGNELMEYVIGDTSDLSGTITEEISDLKSALPFSDVTDESEMTDTSLMYRMDGYIYYYDNVSNAWKRVGSGGGSGASDSTLPILYLIGDVSQMSKDVRSQLQYTFVDSANHTQRTGWCDAKWQGDSSLSYPKKNYTFRFYHDPSFNRKDKINYFDLTKQSKWVTKANWIDHSHARNIVSARLWSAIVHSRVSAPPELLTASPNNGAIDGEPIVIYLNGSYLGLYTMNIPKDDFTFGMDAENPLHCCAYGQYNNNGASTSDTHVLSNEFRHASEIGWECEVPGEWTTDTRAGLIQLINFVMSSTDEQFKENLDTYLDVESALDYYLFCYFIGASDSLAQNMILLTYDGGSKWYCSAYDLDSTFGLYWNGSSFYSSTMACPEDYQDTNNLLWERIEANFGNELYARYRKLRSSVLSLDYINREFEFFMGQIPQDEYDNDIIKWANIPQRSVNHLNQIKTWIASRAEYVDAQIADMASPVPCTGVTLSESSLTFTDYGTHQLFATVQPEDCAQTVNWSSSDTSVATVNQNGLVTTIANGTATITVTCGNYSATCSVTMAYDEFGWSSLPQYDVNESTGEIISGSSYKSKSIPVTKGVWNFQNSAGNFNYLKAVVYDENDNFVFVFTPASNNNLSVDIFEDGYEVILIAYPKSSSANPSQSLTFTKSSEVWGSYNRYKINEETGIISQYSNSNNCVTVTDIPVDSGATYVFTANLTWKNVFQYDTNGNFIKCETTAGTSAAKTATMESNTAYVRLSGVGTVANAKAYTFVKQ